MPSVDSPARGLYQCALFRIQRAGLDGVLSGSPAQACCRLAARFLLLAAALSTCGPAELTAGQSNPSRPPGQTPPVFRSGVEVVNVPVTVRDRSGKPVADLSADDFEILDNKQQQQVLMCQRIDIPLVRPSEQGVEPLAVPLDVASNDFPEQPRSFLILLDDIHVSGRRTEAREKS